MVFINCDALSKYYPCLSAKTASDLLMTNPSTLHQKSTAAIHKGWEAVVRAACPNHL